MAKIPENEPLSQQVSFQATDRFHTRLKSFCSRRGMTIKDFCTGALTKAMDSIERAESRRK